jgi:hypothetical protein
MVRGKSARILTRRSCWRPISVVALPRLARSLSSSRRRASHERNGDFALVRSGLGRLRRALSKRPNSARQKHLLRAVRTFGICYSLGLSPTSG